MRGSKGMNKGVIRGRASLGRVLVEVEDFDGGEVNTVGVAFAGHFGHDSSVVVVAESSGKLVVVHVGFGLTVTPSSCDFLRVEDFELGAFVFPCDDVPVAFVRQLFE